jgi:hypothetical protein
MPPVNATVYLIHLNPETDYMHIFQFTTRRRGFIDVISTNKWLSPRTGSFAQNQMVKNDTPAMDIANSLLAVHQVNLYDCSVKK